MNPVRAWTAAAVTAGLAVVAVGQQQPPTPPANPATQPGLVAPQVPRPPEWPHIIAGRDLKAWVAELNDPDPGVQENAAKTLPLFGPDARRVAVKPLIELIGHSDPGVRVNAMLAVGVIGLEEDQDERRLVQRLIGCIEGTASGSAIRLQATRALAMIGPDAHLAIPSLTRLAGDAAWETRDAAANALGRIGRPVYDDKPGPGGVPVVKRLASKVAMDKLAFTFLKDPSAAVRMEATQALLMLGPPDVKDLDLYIKAVQPYADAVLARLRPYKAGDKESGEKDPAVVVWLKLLGMMYDDRQTGPFVTQLGQATIDRNPIVRVNALRALGVLGPGAKPALDYVRGAVKDPDPMIAAAAITALAGMREEGRPALSDLEYIRQNSKYDELKKLAELAITELRPGKMEPPKKK